MSPKWGVSMVRQRRKLGEEISIGIYARFRDFSNHFHIGLASLSSFGEIHVVLDGDDAFDLGLWLEFSAEAIQELIGEKRLRCEGNLSMCKSLFCSRLFSVDKAV